MHSPTIAPRSREKLGLSLLLILAVCVVVLGFAGEAAAYDVIDQEQTSHAGFMNVDIVNPFAQSFTPGHTGTLSKISVYIGCWSPYTVRAEIRDWTSEDKVLTSTQVSITNYSSHWQDITFSSPPNLLAGHKYSIVLWYVDHTFTWHFAGGDPYPAGAACTYSSYYGWRPFYDYDCAFRTYYEVQDSSPPVVTPPNDITAEAACAAGTAAEFAATATDDVDGSLPATSIHYYTAYGTDHQAEIYSGHVFPLGTTTVTAGATDTSGNMGTATFTITVTDTIAPVLAVPADITVEATGALGAPVLFRVSATDVVDGAVTPQVSPPSGFTFPIGQTTVSVRATDSAGNTGTGSFLVTVLGPSGMLDNVAKEISDAPDDPTTAGGIALDIKESLLAKVNAALAALARGNKNDAKVAMNGLKALINEVEAQTDKSISPEAAETIIAAANGLIDVLGVPSTTGTFVGVDENDTEWQVRLDAVGSGAPRETPDYMLGAGTISFTSWQSLPNGTEVQESFTISVDYYYSVDYFPIVLPGGWTDAGEATAICGPVVVSTGGEGVPAVGDYYLFLAWDGAQGYMNPDGTVGHYPDRWTFVPWSNDPIYMRTFQRTLLLAFSTYGESYHYPIDPNPDTYTRSLWPVTEGDISVIGGEVFSIY